MSEAYDLTVDEVRQAMRLVAECREVARDSAAWNLRAACFFQDQLRSVFVSCFTARFADGGVTAQDLLFAFWADNRFHTRWQKFNADHGYRRYLSVQRFSERYDGQLLTAVRQDLIPDAEWASEAERVDRLAVEQDELIISAVPVADGLSHVFSINRAAGDGPFSQRDRDMVRLVHEELALLFDGRLSVKPHDQPRLSDLTPRLHAVLICLLTGESNKQIAARFRLSSHTVDEYVQVVYRKLNIRSRSELFALASANGWMPKETDDPPRNGGW